MNQQTLELIIWVASGFITITTAIGIIFKFFKKQSNTISSHISGEVKKIVNEDLLKQSEELTQQLNEIREEIRDDRESTNDILMCQARYTLNQAYTHYMSEGYIDDYSMFILEKLYECYKDRHGNGQTGVQMESLRELYKKSFHKQEQ